MSSHFCSISAVVSYVREFGAERILTAVQPGDYEHLPTTTKRKADVFDDDDDDDLESDKDSSSVLASSKRKKPGQNARSETSLVSLTKRFIHTLRNAQDGVVDLNTAASILSVSKRRLYDITNVMEGVLLVRGSCYVHQ
jgi:hypothetical protein